MINCKLDKVKSHQVTSRGPSFSQTRLVIHWPIAYNQYVQYTDQPGQDEPLLLKYKLIDLPWQSLKRLLESADCPAT